MNLPAQSECFELYKKYKTPENVQKHCQKVNQVAMFLSQKLSQAGEDINLDLVDRASLLHDLIRTKGQMKSEGLENMHHAEASYEILKEKYPEMAIVIKSHNSEDLLDSAILDTWEKKILNYADKRVDKEQVVSIEDRMKLGKKRWNLKPDEDKTELFLTKLKELEKKIFSLINLKPGDINEL